MPAPKYDEATIDRPSSCASPARQGARLPQILGMTPGAVDYHCLRRGAEIPKPNRSPMFKKREERRGNHVVRRFTADEDAMILRMELEGRGVCEIARRLGRPHNSIIGRMMTLARQEERQEALSM